MKKNFIHKILVAVFFSALAISGCASSDMQGDGNVVDRSSPGVPSNAGGPSVGNLPQPALSQAVMAGLENPSTLFFNHDSQSWNNLSQDLQVMWVSEAVRLKGLDSIPFPNIPNDTLSSFSNSTLSKFFYTVMGVSSCDDKTSFICLKRPEDGENTKDGKITIEGYIDDCQVQAANRKTDPIVTVIPKKTGAMSEGPYYIYRNTAEVKLVVGAADANGIAICDMTHPKGIYYFNKSISLTQNTGVYTINAGSNKGGTPTFAEPRPTVFWQGPPQVQLVSLTPPRGEDNLYPSTPGDRQKEIPIKGLADAPKVSLSSVVATIKLLSVGTDFSLTIENYDETGMSRRYVTSGGSFNKVGNDYIKEATLKLFPGKNRFRITASHKDFPPPQVLPEFVVDNIDPAIGIKLLTPTEQVVESHHTVDVFDPILKKNVPVLVQKKVDLTFCLTNLKGELEGRMSLPKDGNDCITSWPAGKKPNVQLWFNGVDLSSKYTEAAGIYTLRLQNEGNPIPPPAPCHIDPPNEEICPTPKPTPPVGEVLPMLGNNTIYVKVPPVADLAASNTLVSSFGFGMPHRFEVNNGIVKQDLLKRSISLEIGKKILNEDVRKILSHYLSSDDFRQRVKGLFASAGTPSNLSCTVSSGDKVVDDGKLLIETQNDFNFEKATLDTWEVNEQPGFPPTGRLYAGLTVHGLYGHMNIYTGPNRDIDVYKNVELNIKYLTLRVAARFEKDPMTGISQLIIEKQIDPATGNPLAGVTIVPNLERDASGLAIIPAPADIFAAATIRRKFENSLEANLFCFLGPKVSDPVVGLARWENDLKQLTGYDPNDSLHTSFSFSFLGQSKTLELSFNPTRAGITFNRGGLQLYNLPLRINAGQEDLQAFIAKQNNGDLPRNYLSSIGWLSLPDMIEPPMPYLISCDPANDKNCRTYKFPNIDVYNIGSKVSEDLINEALFAATTAGLLNINLDPNFFTEQEAFLSAFLPTVSGIFGPDVAIDLNQNGINDDGNLPVLLNVSVDPMFPPNLHFLSNAEATSLLGISGNTINPNLKYFRLSLANVNLNVYEVKPKDYATFCIRDKDVDPDFRKTFTDDPNQRKAVEPLVDPAKATENDKRGCSQEVSFFFKKEGDTCPANFKEIENVPISNGPPTSKTPVVAFSGNLIVYGAIQGPSREVLFADKFKKDGTSQPASETNFLRIRLLSTKFGDQTHFGKVNVVTNNTAYNNVGKLETNIESKIFNAALLTDCERFNEVRIPFPDNIFGKKDESNPNDLATKIQTLFGIDYIKLAPNSDALPQLLIDEAIDPKLYLDLLGSLYICSKDQRGSSMCPALN